MEWWLLGIALAILILSVYFLRERFTDTEFKVVEPSISSAVWRSKISANAAIGADEQAYMNVISKFYTEVYVPAQVKPTTTQLEGFLTNLPPTPGVDKDILRKILFQGFHIELGETAASKEEKQVKFKPSDAIFPKNGVDEVRTRKEETYRPVDTQIGELPEGQYAPVGQSYPINEGTPSDKNRPSFSSVP
jgi:hypothetical protein